MPTLIFAISLIDQRHSPNWSATCLHLAQTLRSIRRSCQPSDEIWIAANDGNDPVLQHLAQRFQAQLLEAAFERPAVKRRVGDLDKEKKRRLIGAALRQRGKPIYVMFLDADDLIHKDLSSYIHSDNNQRGYLIEQGYTVDWARHRISRQHDFDQRCGSCYVGYFKPEDLPQHADDRANLFSAFTRHADFEGIAITAGRIPQTVPFPAVAYLTQHESSLTYVKRHRRMTSHARDWLLKAAQLLINVLQWPRHRALGRKLKRELMDAFGLELPLGLSWWISDQASTTGW
jgi:hypothetical protein